MTQSFQRWLRKWITIFIIEPVTQQIAARLNRIEGDLNHMALDLTALNTAVAAIAEDVTAVKAVITDLKTLVQQLKGQLAAGSLDQAAIDAATDTLTQADADLDATTAPPTT